MVVVMVVFTGVPMLVPMLVRVLVVLAVPLPLVAAAVAVTTRSPGTFAVGGAAAYAKGISPTKAYPAPNVFRIPNCTESPGNKCTIGNSADGASRIRTGLLPAFAVFDAAGVTVTCFAIPFITWGFPSGEGITQSIA